LAAGPGVAVRPHGGQNSNLSSPIDRRSRRSIAFPRAARLRRATMSRAGYSAAMSQENVETVRRSLDAYATGDIEGMLAFVDSDGELQSAIIGGVEGKMYRGHAGFRSWFAETQVAFEALSTELTEFRDLGDRVVGLGRIRARGRESGVELDSATGWLFTLRDGKIVRAEGWLDPRRALEAAGLSG
jgi:ketosteroid isomerase-like protein